MENIKLEAFTIVGIAVKTTNENGQSAIDIDALWQKFMGEGILEKYLIKLITPFIRYTPIMKEIIRNLIPRF